MAVLCQCECHANCPVASDEPVPMESWRTQCNCPGAAEAQLQQAESERASELRKQQVGEILAGVDRSRARSRDEFRAELERAYEDRGIEPQTYELDGHAGVLQAACGPKHLQGVRVLGVFGRLISDAVRDIRNARD